MALSCFSSVNGQTGIGVKGGVNIANITDNPYKPRVSVHGGIFVNRSISRHFAIQPELLFSGEGQRVIHNSLEHRWSLNYIQIPLMFQVYPVSQLYIEAGPQVGFLISAKDKIEGVPHSNIEANLSTVQFAIGAGLGVKVTDRIAVYGRYNFGLNDITTIDLIEHKSNVVQVGLAVRLNDIIKPTQSTTEQNKN